MVQMRRLKVLMHFRKSDEEATHAISNTYGAGVRDTTQSRSCRARHIRQHEFKINLNYAKPYIYLTYK